MRWRPITLADREDYLAMATAFYNTDAVLTPIPLANMENTFDELMRSDVYTTCAVCETEDGLVGYALLSKSFSQEAGGLVLWIEELYLKDRWRHRGYGRAFLRDLLAALPPDIKRVRLEAERENKHAVSLYESLGFRFFEYDQMVLER